MDRQDDLQCCAVGMHHVQAVPTESDIQGCRRDVAGMSQGCRRDVAAVLGTVADMLQHAYTTTCDRNRRAHCNKYPQGKMVRSKQTDVFGTVSSQMKMKACLVDGGQQGLQQVLVPGFVIMGSALLLDGGGSACADVAQQCCWAHQYCLTRQCL